MFTISNLQRGAIILLAAQSIPVMASPSLRIVPNSTVTDLTEVNCGGSFWCPRIDTRYNYINNYLQDWMRYSIADDDIYYLGVQIACATVTIWFPPLGTNAYCAYTRAFTAGNQGPAGINGTMIKQKMEELRIGGCFACGKAPCEGGIFEIDYVAKTKIRCGRPGQVICSPSVPGVHREGLEQAPRPVLSTFIATLFDDEVSLRMPNIQDS